MWNNQDNRIDNVTPKGKWEFDSEVARCFANMLERSVPDYRSMRSLVYELGEEFIKPGTWITDIGCSTGLAIEPFYQKHREENHYFLVDNSEDMLKECRGKFMVGIEAGFVKVVNGSFYEQKMPWNQSLVLSVLSLQFMPTTYRQKILCEIYSSMNSGGALILVEKIVGDGGMDDLMVEMYYRMKRENGYSEEAIMAKRKSLENVLSPLKAGWNVGMMREAGFRKLDMFWRCLNFCGWIAVK